MTVTQKLGGKPSKAPLWAEALRLYLSANGPPDLVQIAEAVGLRADTLVQVAERQAWSKRRAIVVRDQTATRESARQHVDSLLVDASTKHVTIFSESLQQLSNKIVSISTEADSSITDPHLRAKEINYLIRTKVSLIHDASKCFRELVQIGCDVGLVRSESRDVDGNTRGGKLDMSKLTQLNVTINAALAGHEKPAGVEPQRVIELGEDVI